MKKLEVTDITFHMNGSGHPFSSIRFSFIGDDKIHSNMLAIMPIAECPGDVEYDGCYVIDMNEPTKSWDGEEFLPGLVPVLTEFLEKDVDEDEPTG